MDPSYESSEDEAEAMAKAMGFSSFGTQGPTKKRKFNPKVDAMVEGQELASLDRGGKKGQGSGGNEIPLGKPRLPGIVSKRNQDKTGPDQEDKAPKYINIRSSPLSKRDSSDEEGGPDYIDTSLPPPIEDARATQEKIDAIVANRNPPPPLDVKTMTKSQIPETGRRASKEFMGSLPDESKSSAPSVLIPSVPASNHSNSHSSGSIPGQRGHRNELWYIGYYDPSFNENPWARLERINGLESKGTWIEKAEQVA